MTTYSMTHDGLERISAGASWLGNGVARTLARARAAWAARRIARQQARQDRLMLDLAAHDHRVMADLRAAVSRAEPSGESRLR
jgi:hypothetical protein